MVYHTNLDVQGGRICGITIITRIIVPNFVSPCLKQNMYSLELVTSFLCRYHEIANVLIFSDSISLSFYASSFEVTIPIMSKVHNSKVIHGILAGYHDQFHSLRSPCTGADIFNAACLSVCVLKMRLWRRTACLIFDVFKIHEPFTCFYGLHTVILLYMSLEFLICGDQSIPHFEVISMIT